MACYLKGLNEPVDSLATVQTASGRPAYGRIDGVV